jgi:hypothetical protein
MFSKKSFVAGCVLAGGSAVFASQNISAIVAGTHFKFNGVEKPLPAGYVSVGYQGHTYVPARFVAEQLGAQVGFDSSSNTVTFTTATTNNGGGATSNVKSYPVNVDIMSGPMKMHISKVTLDPAYKKDQYTDPIKAIVLAVDVENTSDDTVSWYPTQGSLTLNTKEQAEGSMSIYYSDQVDGDFVGKVIKKGNIVVQVSSDLAQITSFNYKIEGAFTDKLDQIGEQTITPITLQ